VLSEVNENYRIGFINCCEECPNYPECLIDPELGCGDVNVFCDPCGPWQTVTVGPLLTTRWGQRCTYNEQCPDEGCFNRCLLPNPNALTGCVATAIAQVLRYW
ncbi:C10 family peptidase, partial [Arthrospira platensis SPKY1]|nr:C10 family peptidase [Arthrospira platensis SPKY1]